MRVLIANDFGPPIRYRRQLWRINPEVLILLGREPGATLCHSPIPPDARIVGRSLDDRGDLILLLESESFPEVLEGSLCPEMRVPYFVTNPPRRPAE